MYLGDDVRVAFSGQVVEEIPSTPQRANAQHPDDEAPDEERRHEPRMHLRCDHGGCERRTGEGEFPALFPSKLSKAGIRLLDRSCVHDLLLLAHYATNRFRIDSTCGTSVDYGPEVTLGPDLRTPRRRGRPRDAGAREAILDATLELLAERGFHATTMDSIAERAGVGKNTIYRRWPAKDDLIIDAFLHFTADIELRASPDDDVYSRLLEHVRSLARFYADPLVSRLIPGLLGELQRNRAFADAYAERVVGPLRQPIVALIELARERGELRANADPDQIADMLVGPGFLRMLFAFGLPKTQPTYPDALLDAIWRGVAAPA
jgi:AcrR family transcriptional regulator